MRTVFVYIDKLSQEVRTFGSVVALSMATGISKDTLYLHFSRKKEREYATPMFRIIKSAIESA